jgi:hypothetical protein
VLDEAELHAPPALVRPDVWTRLRALPPALTRAATVGALECHLDGEAPRVDLQVCVTAASGGRGVLFDGLPQLDRFAAGDARWAATVRFLRAWGEPRSVLFAGVPVVWLELDAPCAEQPDPAPFVIFTPDPLATLASGTALPLALVRTVSEGIWLLGDGVIEPDLVRSLARCLGSLPGATRLLHVALRPSESGRFVRLVLRMPWRALGAYLDCVGWQGSRAGLDAWLERSCPSTVLQSINLDVGPGVGPRVGVEYHFPTPPASDHRWRTVFDALADAGACTAERRAALEAWPSHGADENALGAARTVDRDLLLKVVFETGAPLRAKAYLPFAARPPSA